MSSTIQGATYDYPVTVTPSDTVADPNGPFTGLYVSVGGNLKFTPRAGPSAATSMTIVVVAGTYVRWPVSRVWSGVTTATVIGLVSPVIPK